MKQPIVSLFVLCLWLTACNESGGGGTPGGGITQNNKGGVAEWQASLLGQEGHGGDAIVCFSIPVERALYKVNTAPEDKCQPGTPCKGEDSVNIPGRPGSPSGVTWRMTEEGRRSIRSAQPLEQYLGERISSKKAFIDELNRVSVEEGYERVLQSFAKLPAAFNRISETHSKLGWLTEDGIASEYGLMDVNDSGFVNENEIDKAYCKELQAVVRRDNQLWYDADIVGHFDNAGKVLIQLHEEIYAWGKTQDKINWEIPGPPAHETSTKTRRLILKLLDQNLNHGLLNENLKALGLSTMYWDSTFKVPTSVGYYMDSDACLSEQRFLRNALASAGYGMNFWLAVENLFSNRYLKGEKAWPVIQVRNNFPDVLSNMIAYTVTFNGNYDVFRAEFMRMMERFEKPESCQAGF